MLVFTLHDLELLEISIWPSNQEPLKHGFSCTKSPCLGTNKIYHGISSSGDIILIVRAVSKHQPKGDMMAGNVQESLTFSHSRNSCHDCLRIASEAKATCWTNTSINVQEMHRPISLSKHCGHNSDLHLAPLHLVFQIWWCPQQKSIKK
jgi:hypothetical protein